MTSTGPVPEGGVASRLELVDSPLGSGARRFRTAGRPQPEALLNAAVRTIPQGGENANAVRRITTLPSHIDVGSGAPVILLHGQPGTAETWLPLIRSMSQDGMRLIALDRPGYGRSETEATGFAGNAAEVIAVMDMCEIDRAIVVGYSWATGVALHLGAHRADRLDGIVLVAPIGGPGTLKPSDFWLAHPTLGRLIIRPAIASTGVAALLPGIGRLALPEVRWLDRRDRIRVAACWMRRRTTASFLAEHAALLGDFDSIRFWAQSISAHVELVAGTRDRIVTPASVSALAATLTDHTVRLVPDGHHRLSASMVAAIRRALLSIAHPDAA